jgi:hypothetical protein
MNMLAKPTEPLVLADGTKIDPISGRVIRDDEPEIVEIPSATEAQRLVTETRRTLAELPAVPDTMNPINVVLCYDLFGMSTNEIAVATKLTIEQVESIKAHDAYGKMRASVCESIQSASENEVVDIMSKGRVRAARKLFKLIDDHDPDIALKASSQILTHSKAMHEKNDGMDVMEIKVIRKNADQEMPSITLKL